MANGALTDEWKETLKDHQAKLAEAGEFFAMQRYANEVHDKRLTTLEGKVNWILVTALATLLTVVVNLITGS